MTRDKRTVSNFLSMDIETWALGESPGVQGLSLQERKELDNGYLLESTRKTLALLREYGARITLFMVGAQLEWYPELAEEILADGHELGLHSHRHCVISDLDQLRRDLESAMPVVEKYGIRAFRAPNVKLPEGGFEVLAGFGFEFDSSTYGPFSLAGSYDGIVEIPVSSLRLINKNAEMFLPRDLSLSTILRQGELPFGSSYFMGLLGEGTKYLIRHLNRKGEPAVVFIHQWQLYPMPEGSYPPRSYVFRNPAYWPLTRNLVKLLRGFLEEFEFGTMEALAAEYINKGSGKC